jgi:hypothetical protein
VNLTKLLEMTIISSAITVSPTILALPDMIDALSQSERDTFLKSLNCDPMGVINARNKNNAYIYRSVVRSALKELCSRQTEWTNDLALHALGACRQWNEYESIGGVATLSAMKRSGVCFAPGEARDREFAGLANAFGDVGKGGDMRRAAHDLFGMIYVPRAVSSYNALNDKPFQTYLKILVDGLHNVAVMRELVKTQHPEWYIPCSGQAVSPDIFFTLKPKLHRINTFRLSTCNTLDQAGAFQELVSWSWWFPFAYPDLLPIDEYRVSSNAQAYSKWEEIYGETRWVEPIVPSLPKTIEPHIVGHLSTAKGSKPSKRWTKTMSDIISNHEGGLRSGIITVLSRLGSADFIKASEASWRDAGAYAYLHQKFRNRYREDGEPKLKELPELLYLPWIKDGKTVLHHSLPDNPMTLSESNTIFARGLIWAASLWQDEEMVDALARTAGGAMQPLDLGHHGLRMRSLATFNACVWSLLTIGSEHAQLALAALSRDATDPRARKCLQTATSESTEIKRSRTVLRSQD